MTTYKESGYPRLGTIKLNQSFEYIVDLDNPAMVEHAKSALIEDLESLSRENNLHMLLTEEVDGSGKYCMGDIEDFLIENYLDEDGEYDKNKTD